MPPARRGYLDWLRGLAHSLCRDDDGAEGELALRAERTGGSDGRVYTIRFRVTDRILLTGHSHQAWPDVGLEAQQRAWLDAAEYVDDKWAVAAEQADLDALIKGIWPTTLQLVGVALVMGGLVLSQQTLAVARSTLEASVHKP